jgi:BirA family biotin operon repressor/biotin-[acetyl-CoA-carboxylase] ligase
MAGDALLLSLGVNLNGTETDLPAELRERATTLQLLTGSPVDQEHVVAATFVALDAWWAALRRDPDAVLTRWDALDVTRGARVTVADGAERVSGRALGVDACGRLRLETASGSVLLLLGGEVGIID